MKKNLLLAALFMGAMSANAQVETCFVDVDAKGITGEAAPIGAGTVLAESENVTMAVAFDDNFKSTTIDFSGYSSATVNGNVVDMVTGITGNTNPSGQSLGADNTSTPPTAGCVVKFTVKKDGFLTVFGKMSSNKEYYVWEGDEVSAAPMAYTFGMDWTAGVAAGASINSIVYQLPADEFGYIDFTNAEIGKYVNGAKMFWPEKIVLGADAADVKKNGLGFITFPVFAEAGTYMVQAAGSKISTCGAVFTTEKVTELTLTGFDEVTAEPISKTLLGTGTGIGGITVDGEDNADAPVYNLAGQRVNKSAKGILIQNGKKFINK